MPSLAALPAIEMPAAFASNAYALRPAREADRDFERRLFETARTDTAVLAAWPPQTRKAFLDQQFEFQRVHYARAHPQAERLIVTLKGAPVGRLILDRVGAPWCIVDIALLPSARGRGLGGALLAAILQSAAWAGASLALNVEIGNPARRLYERLGFSVTATELPYHAMLWRPAAQLKMA